LKSDPIFAELALFEWQDRQMSAVSNQLTVAYPDLERAIDEHIDGLGVRKLATLPMRLGKMVEGQVNTWAETQRQAAAARAVDE
jgi:hypothetical protein